MLVLSFAGLIACQTNPNVSTSEVTSDEITLSEKQVEMLFGDTYELAAKTSSPANLVWSSSDESVLTVDDGTVSAVGAGEANIIVSNGSKQASCHFKVGFNNLLPTLGIENLSSDTLSLVKGSSFALRGSVLFNEKIYSCPISVSLGNEEILTLDGNSLVAKKSGTTSVIVKGVWNNFDNPLMQKPFKSRLMKIFPCTHK